MSCSHDCQKKDSSQAGDGSGKSDDDCNDVHTTGFRYVKPLSPLSRAQLSSDDDDSGSDGAVCFLDSEEDELSEDDEFSDDEGGWGLDPLDRAQM
ncbi:hypothetical protein SPRG_09368 [Saprolegnia parasitica CBS 223.65]|uniref:Uncharacterized protein n=1 Tax=Saprolegnia parasitica (strain CBS 223.65) TaxID=695850 RepID=A0A067CFU6_SAPPC|nr:hypothetical protein SPRG_09368 [Saprolegnia parasitica CBS 223.65]KDO25426.1 hypothetical protein SPRG_09368 [Saprolegnia parasitica CBS 223.65]|eukprot:XP_012203853.1 hypothetical protein SPRG_09368 [Saprolegnia parasitica CBS 223.65]